MKKSVVILIALIYVASIALVGFLGLQAKTYNDIIYVESLSILSEYSVNPGTGEKFVIFKSVAGERSLHIQCKVLPENATDQNVVFRLDRDCTFATIDENGLLTFSEDITSTVSTKVYIYSYQNPTISEEILVYYMP